MPQWKILCLCHRMDARCLQLADSPELQFLRTPLLQLLSFCLCGSSCMHDGGSPCTVKLGETDTFRYLWQVFVGGVPRSATEEQLTEFAQAAGEVCFV